MVGKIVRKRDPSVRSIAAEICRQLATMFPWVTMTPFGSPVEMPLSPQYPLFVKDRSAPSRELVAAMAFRGTEPSDPAPRHLARD